MAQMSIHQRVIENIYIQCIRSAFIALLPVMLLSALLILITNFYLVLGVTNPVGQFIRASSEISTLIFPLLLMITLSYFLGKSLNKSPIVTVFLTTLCYFCLDSEEVYDGMLEGEQYIPYQPYSIILPFLSAWFLQKTYRIRRLRILDSSQLSSHLRVHMNLIIPCIISFIGICTLVSLAEPLAKLFISPIVSLVNESSVFTQSLFQIILSNLFWFVGIHGDNTYNLLFEPYFLSEDIAPNLLSGTMIDLFTAIGGTGPGASLILAILIYSRDNESRKIAKVSAPFSFFNISEILIYGLPIVFNPFLFIPFMVVPIVQFLVAYFAISVGLVEFAGARHSWITPPLLNAYIASGNFSVVLLQVICIVIGIYIFSPFIKRGHAFNHDAELATSLARKLAVKAPLESQQEHELELADQSSFRRNISEEIMTGKLFLTYSPILSSHNGQFILEETHHNPKQLEVIINLRCSDGHIVGKELIGELQGHLSEGIVYTWAFKEITEQLGEWQHKGYYPKLHLTLNRDILASSMFVDSIISIFAKRHSQLVLALADEVLTNNTDKELEEHLDKLYQAGFTLSVNQYKHEGGSLLHLTESRYSQVNISLNSLGNRKSAEILLPAICKFYQSLDIAIQLSDINSPADVELTQKMDINYAQGVALGAPIKAEQLSWSQ